MTKIKQTRTFYLLKNTQIPSTTFVIYYTCSQMGENEKQPKKALEASLDITSSSIYKKRKQKDIKGSKFSKINHPRLFEWIHFYGSCRSFILMILPTPHCKMKYKYFYVFFRHQKKFTQLLTPKPCRVEVDTLYTCLNKYTD